LYRQLRLLEHSLRKNSIPAKTKPYAWKYLTRGSLVLYSGSLAARQNQRAPAGVDLSALQYAFLNSE
jgi:hypothetical protein